MVLIAISILSVPVYMSLIMPFGLLGAFIAAFCLYTLQVCLVYRIGKPYYTVEYEFRKLVTMFAVAAVIVIVICQLSIETSSWVADINSLLSPLMKKIFEFLHLDHYKNGKLLMVFTEKLKYVIEGLIKTILAMFYLIFFFALGIIRKDHITKIIHKMNRMTPRKLQIRARSQL